MLTARVATRRIKQRPDASLSTPTRPQSMKNQPQIDRAKISSPVALLSTTNMRLDSAKDIATLGHASHSSTHSTEDSDHSATTTRSRSSSNGSQDTLTDASSVDSAPSSPAPNHLSEYFAAATKEPRRSASSGNLRQLKSETPGVEGVPALPERALSHSKRAHERLAQKKSLQNMKPRGSLHSNRSSREHRTSLDMSQSTIKEEAHPFGKELEQLNEVAEEFVGVVRDADFEADMVVIRERGLAMLCAADYLQEIEPLFHSRFANPQPIAWI